jgi:curved DNA-binding protein CbpA
MSSSSAGKFQDHYIVLGVETNADTATIHAAYSKLAQEFHPDNPKTGDPKKFDSLNQAYEVLCDPELRIAFDKVKGVDHEAGNPKFTGADFFRALAMGAELRAAVLCILYDRRRMKSFKPSLPMRLLEGMLNIQGEGLNFALWYLKKRGFVTSDDKSAMEITVEGMDFLETNRPSAEAVMQFIKKESLMPQPELPMEPKIVEPLLSVLGRALQRTNSGGK